MKVFSKWKWELLSPLAGALMTLSFAPFELWYLAVLSLVFAIYSWEKTSFKRAFLRGFLYGAGLFGTGVSWVYISIHDFGGAHYLAALILSTLFCLFWALFPGVSAFFVVKLSDVCRSNTILVKALLISAVWILVEYFRGYLLLNGFPWLQVSYSQLDAPLSGYIPVLGGYGTGYMLVFSSAIVAYSLGQRTLWKRTAWILSIIWGAGFTLSFVNWTNPIGKAIQVTLVQGNVPQNKKWLPEYRIRTMLDYQHMTEKHWDSDVVIWPETAIPAFLHQVEEFFIRPLENKAKQNHTDVIISLPGQGNQQYDYYNMVLTLGRERGTYKKNHLLPFGEYLPLQPLSGWVLDTIGVQLGNFTSGGDSQPLLHAGGYPFATSICYEDAFSSAFISALPAAAYLINVTNDAWFGDSLEPYQHMQIARMRAMESGRFLLRATNTGVTGFIGPKGRVVKQAPLFIKTTITESIYPMGGITPYARMGDKPVIGMVFLAAILGLFLNSGKKTTRSCGKRKFDG